MTLFLFFDESGNMDFSSNGTKYFAFGALTTRQPVQLLWPLSDCRYALIAGGTGIEMFQAAEDRQRVRDKVFEIPAQTGGSAFYCVMVEEVVQA